VALLVRVACEMAAAALVTYACLQEFTGTTRALLVAIGVMVLVSYVAVGVSPRTIGRQHPLNTATAAAYILLPLARIMGPIPSLLILIGNALTPGKGFRRGPFASEAELRALVDLAEKESLIEDDERRMVHSVFELGDTLVREVMVPRTDLVVIERYKTIRQALTLALRSGFSRIPVSGESEDDIVGIVYLKDLVRKTHISRDAESELVSTAMRPAAFVPDSTAARPASSPSRTSSRRSSARSPTSTTGNCRRWRSWVTTATGSPPASTSPISVSCTGSTSTTTRTWRPSGGCWRRRWAGCRSPVRQRSWSSRTGAGCG
jgi:CBS domain containing-hemolysin-like protein